MGAVSLEYKLSGAALKGQGRKDDNKGQTVVLVYVYKHWSLGHPDKARFMKPLQRKKQHELSP